ncbi:hypothetical protein PV374_39730, partial [Streptomyces scabiei]|nr:hypothetical protein [Streptomyces scabiei]
RGLSCERRPQRPHLRDPRWVCHQAGVRVAEVGALGTALAGESADESGEGFGKGPGEGFGKGSSS